MADTLAFHVQVYIVRLAGLDRRFSSGSSNRWPTISAIQRPRNYAWYATIQLLLGDVVSDGYFPHWVFPVRRAGNRDASII